MTAELRERQPTVAPPSVTVPPRRPRHRQRPRLLHVADFVVVLGVMFASLFIRFGTDWPKSFSTYLWGFLVATVVQLTIYYFGGLYEPELRLGQRWWLPRVTMLTFVAILIDGATALLTDYYLMPRGNLVIVLVLASLGVSGNRLLARRYRIRRWGHPRVLIVGAPTDIDLAESHLAEVEPKTTIVGHSSSTERLIDDVVDLSATDVLLVSAGLLDSIYPHPLQQLEERRVGVFQHITPADTLLGLQRSREIAGMPFVAVRGHALPASRSHFKRCLELVYLVLLLPLLVVVGMLVGLYVRILAGPGIIYRQTRVGRDGRGFTMLKFRTMVAEAETSTGAVKAESRDPRIVRGLTWVRRTRLDELPQFVNVARGEMCIVGPRPERPEFTAEYELLIPGYGRRHDIPPGITGLAQVHGGYATDPQYKLGHDLQYLVNWSPILDLQIMARSVLAMLTFRLPAGS